MGGAQSALAARRAIAWLSCFVQLTDPSEFPSSLPLAVQQRTPARSSGRSHQLALRLQTYPWPGRRHVFIRHPVEYIHATSSAHFQTCHP